MPTALRALRMLPVLSHGEPGLSVVAGKSPSKSRLLTRATVRVKYGMGSRKYMARNRWKRARKGLLHKER